MLRVEFKINSMMFLVRWQTIPQRFKVFLFLVALFRHPQIGLELNIFNVLKNKTERKEEKRGEKATVKLRTLHSVNKIFSIIFPHFLAKQTENNNFVRNVVRTNNVNG